MLDLFVLWALVLLLGLLCLPLTVTVFANLPDRGWAFSKTLGLAVFAFCVWFPLMVIQALPFNRLFIIGVALILVALSLYGFLRMRQSIIQFVQQHKSYILVTELIFLGMVCLLGWLRSYGPAIQGYEMFMDAGFIAAIMRSPHFPPNDMWYAGEHINYYYYAHYTIAMLGKMVGQAPSIIFNTGICIFFGLCASNLFGLTCNIISWAQHIRSMGLQAKQARQKMAPDPVVPLLSLKKAMPYGLLAFLMALVFGNLASTRQWWTSHETTDYHGIWFAPTRVIKHNAVENGIFQTFASTINEFPAFSFLLSCFHAHVLALAFTIIAIGVAFNLLLSPGKGFRVFGHGWGLGLTLACSALLIGGLFVMNGWDYPTYMALALVCLCLQQWLMHDARFSRILLVNCALPGVSLIALSLILFSPFYLSFISPSQGIGQVSPEMRSLLSDELLIYGLFAFLFLTLLLASVLKNPTFEQLAGKSAPGGAGSQIVARQRRRVSGTVPIVESTQSKESTARSSTTTVDEKVAPEQDEEFDDEDDTPVSWPVRYLLPAGALLYLLLCFLVLRFVPNSATLVAGSSFALLGALLLLYHLRDQAHCFTLLLGATAFALVAFCEIFFLRDAFAEGPYERMNTVFKFYFQAWILLSVACAAGIFFILETFHPISHRFSFYFRIWVLSALVSAAGLFASRIIFSPALENLGIVFYLQCWFILSLVGVLFVFGIRRIWRPASGRTLHFDVQRLAQHGVLSVWCLLLLFLIGASMVYPLAAPYARYVRVNQETAQPYLQSDYHLDGLEYMKDCYPTCGYGATGNYAGSNGGDYDTSGDYEAIRWLNEQVEGDPVIVETVGGDYTFYSRISTFTGLPTIMGWYGHEYQWRLTWIKKDIQAETAFNSRMGDIDQIYTNTDNESVLAVMRQYNAQYIYVGALEKQKYSIVDLNRFSSFMEVVYNANGVTIYKVR